MNEKIKELFMELLEIENEQSPYYCEEHNAENIIQWLTDITNQGLAESELGIDIPKGFDFSFCFTNTEK